MNGKNAPELVRKIFFDLKVKKKGQKALAKLFYAVLFYFYFLKK
jgi:hypothetical protein